MSKRYLGDEIDIHAGGEDLIFPHHENEIAQSEAANGVTFSRYWMHNGFLNIDNRKMSKSLGNFFTVREIGEKYDLQVLRFFMLQAHYRSPLNFSEELMEAAKNGLDRICTGAQNLKYISEHTDKAEMDAEEQEILQGADAFENKFCDAMDDDFNTADAVSAVFELVKYSNQQVTETSSRALADGMYELLEKLTGVLGIIIRRQDEILDEEIEAMIAERQAARKNRDFARADEIRSELLAKGILLEDTREGVKWKKA
jgi:cysteinyl-tRNA synthetase